jgi:S1-C subfamily serine protease
MRDQFGLLRETVLRVQCEDLGTAGSGFIVSSSGLVLTSFSNIGRLTRRRQPHLSSRIEIQLDVGMFCAARVVSEGADPASFDFAVLQIETSGLGHLPLGGSESVRPGDEVCFAGFPIDCARVSAHRGWVASIFDASSIHLRERIEAGQVVHVDGAWNPGYSGGPVLCNGRVIGILSSRLGEHSCRGFAIDHALQYLRSRNFRIGNLTDRTLF